MKKRILIFLSSIMMVINMLWVCPDFSTIANENYLWPAQGARNITQYYYYNSEEDLHDGLDISGALDTPILATMSGTVVAVIDGDVPGKWVGYGKGVVIQHSNGLYSHYAHMNYTSVSVNQYVNQGHQIGGMGTTGYSTGVHLHFAIASSIYGAGGRINVNPDVINYIYDILPPCNHSYTNIVSKEPSCTENGTMTYTCSCGDSYTEPITAIGHKYLIEEVEPTLESEGYSIYTCEVCDDTYKGDIIPKIVLGEDGWYYSQKQPSFVSDEEYEIEYQHTYTTKSVSSPGDDWVVGEISETKYENVGEPFSSAKQVETSDNLVMTDYYFYHFCGPTTGNVANYESTDEFSHYDSITQNHDVIVLSTGLDGEYPYFILANASNNSNIFCASGETCDGSWGTHGPRSKAWYRMATYQNRKQVVYYNYTKQTEWETKKDSTASSIVYRYRAKDSILPGDANNDGVIDLKDVVIIRRYVAGGWDVEIDTANADVNADDTVDLKDVVLIRRYIAGGWDVELK